MMASTTQVRCFRHENLWKTPRHGGLLAGATYYARGPGQDISERVQCRANRKFRDIQVQGHLCHSLQFLSKLGQEPIDFPALRLQLAMSEVAGREAASNLSQDARFSPKNVKSVSSPPALAH